MRPAAALRRSRERPLVVVVVSVPLLGEAVEAALEFAEVLAFEAGRGDVATLLRWLDPDAVVVDNEPTACEAAAFAAGSELAVLHLAVREGRLLRLDESGGWELVEAEGASPETLRGVLAGALFARGGAR